MTFGVPQGTILGPVLFTVYINRMFTLETQENIISFADDTVIELIDFPKISLNVNINI